MPVGVTSLPLALCGELFLKKENYVQLTSFWPVTIDERAIKRKYGMNAI